MMPIDLNKSLFKRLESWNRQAAKLWKKWFVNIQGAGNDVVVDFF